MRSFISLMSGAESLRGAAAVRETLHRLPAAPVMTLPFHTPGGMWVADRIYRWVARNRARLSRWLGVNKRREKP